MTTPLPQWKPMCHAIENYLRGWEIEATKDHHDPKAFLTTARSQIHRKVVEEIVALRGVKFYLSMNIRLKYKKPPHQPTDFEKRSAMEPILTADGIPTALDKSIQTIMGSIETHIPNGSGWVVDHQSTLQPHIAQYSLASNY